MKQKNFLTSVTVLLVVFNMNAQVGIGTDNPEPSAILELQSKSKGLLLPRIDDVNNVQNPVDGLLVYNTKENCVSLYKNKEWICLAIKNYNPEATVVIEAHGGYFSSETLTTDVTGFDDQTATYQWYRANDAQGSGETLIQGAVNKTYTLTAEDKDKYITVKVKPEGKGEEVTAAYTEKITLIEVFIKAPGGYFSSETLTADVTGFDDQTVIYQWYRANNAQGSGEILIQGAVNKTYTLTAEDKDKYITVKVKLEGKGEEVTAAYTKKIKLNHKPVVKGVDITFGNCTIYNLRWIFLDFKGLSDGDGDKITFEYTVYQAKYASGTGETRVDKGTVEVKEQDTSIRLYNYEPGKYYQLRAKPYDGREYGEEIKSEYKWMPGCP